MDFAWDADKDAENQAKHGISFEEATHIFDGPILLVVVHTDRGEKTRLISARKANRRERQVFYDYLTTTFE